MKNILLTALVIFGLTTISMAQVPAYVPTNGLVGWWPFTGNANDLSGNANNGTITSGVTLTTDRFSNLNSAYSFDGSGDYIDCGNSASVNFTGSHTISAWLYASDLTFPRGIVSKSAIGNAYALVAGPYISSDLNFLGLNTGYLVPTLKWVHVVSVFDSVAQTISLDTNGVLYGTQSVSFSSISTSPDNLYLGSHRPTLTPDWTWSGKLDDIGIWNRALTACEINQLYTSGISTITTTTSAATICVGASTTITASGATTYAWMPGNLTGATITVSPATTTTYTVTGTNASGCTNTATRIITVNPLPIVTAAISSAAVCINDANATLTGTPTGGVWSGTGVTGSNFNPAIAGLGAQTASYSYTDANGCVGIIETVNIYVYSCVGLEENLLANGVSVYPNPAKSQINVKVDEPLIGSVYTVYDKTGKLVLSGKINYENTIIEVGNLSAGVYLLNIGENLKQTFKVIKE